MEIREINENDDLDAVASIYVESWRTAYKGIVPQAFLDGLSGSGWSAMLRERKFSYFIAIENEQPVGTASISPARDETKKGWGELVSIYLLPAYWGKGIAEHLFHKAIDALRHNGHQSIYLWVLKENIRTAVL